MFSKIERSQKNTDQQRSVGINPLFLKYFSGHKPTLLYFSEQKPTFISVGNKQKKQTYLYIAWAYLAMGLLLPKPLKNYLVNLIFTVHLHSSISSWRVTTLHCVVAVHYLYHANAVASCRVHALLYIVLLQCTICIMLMLLPPRVPSTTLYCVVAVHYLHHANAISS